MCYICCYIYTGTFSTQIAEATFNEIKAETELDKAAKNTSSNTTSVLDGVEMSGGVEGLEVFGKKIVLPKVVKEVRDSIRLATERIDAVILNEVSILYAP